MSMRKRFWRALFELGGYAAILYAGTMLSGGIWLGALVVAVGMFSVRTAVKARVLDMQAKPRWRDYSERRKYQQKHSGDILGHSLPITSVAFSAGREVKRG